MIKITFCSLSFQSTFILVSFSFILPYSVVIPPCSSIFRYHSCLFRLILVSRVIPPCFGIFWFIPVYSALLVCHSASFRDILRRYFLKPLNVKCIIAKIEEPSLERNIIISILVCNIDISSPLTG